MHSEFLKPDGGEAGKPSLINLIWFSSKLNVAARACSGNLNVCVLTVMTPGSSEFSAEIYVTYYFKSFQIKVFKIVSIQMLNLTFLQLKFCSKWIKPRGKKVVIPDEIVLTKTRPWKLKFKNFKYVNV